MGQGILAYHEPPVKATKEPRGEWELMDESELVEDSSCDSSLEDCELDEPWEE